MNKLKVLSVSIMLMLLLSLAGPSIDAYARPLTLHSPGLGAADSFAILAGTPNISNVPTSVITGDVGLSPATGAGIGLTAPQVGGTIYAVDAAGPAGSVMNPALLTQAKNDLITAYDGLAATDNATCTTTYAGATNLSTLSPLGPGIYCAPNGFFLPAGGNLTLSGSGVWIFRSQTDIIANPGSSVTGSDPCNVWWRAESSVTLDTSVSFIGNVLALTSITMNTGATLSGRALARNGAVTLQSNTITRPICAAPPVVPAATTAPGEEHTTRRIKLTAQAGGGNAISALPNTGGAPIRNEDFPWSLVIVAGVSALALVSGVRAYRRAHLPKQ